MLRGDNLTKEEFALFVALHEECVKVAHKFINIIANCVQDAASKFAQWMLTHSPDYRWQYSDNAALTRARADAVAASAISEASRPPEQERMILLRMQARIGQELVSDEESQCRCRKTC